jgi:hypothetical protein
MGRILILSGLWLSGSYVLGWPKHWIFRPSSSAEALLTFVVEVFVSLIFGLILDWLAMLPERIQEPPDNDRLEDQPEPSQLSSGNNSSGARLP